VDGLGVGGGLCSDLCLSEHDLSIVRYIRFFFWVGGGVLM
jgi:hypothetical protein